MCLQVFVFALSRAENWLLDIAIYTYGKKIISDVWGLEIL